MIYTIVGVLSSVLTLTGTIIGILVSYKIIKVSSARVFSAFKSSQPELKEKSFEGKTFDGRFNKSHDG